MRHSDARCVMTCAFPGCLRSADEPVKVKASRTDVLNHLPLRRLPDEDEPEVPAGVALVSLCPTHRAEVEKLGWLAPREEDEGDG